MKYWLQDNLSQPADLSHWPWLPSVEAAVWYVSQSTQNVPCFSAPSISNFRVRSSTVCWTLLPSATGIWDTLERKGSNHQYPETHALTAPLTHPQNSSGPRVMLVRHHLPWPPHFREEEIEAHSYWPEGRSQGSHTSAENSLSITPVFPQRGMWGSIQEILGGMQTGHSVNIELYKSKGISFLILSVLTLSIWG